MRKSFFFLSVTFFVIAHGAQAAQDPAGAPQQGLWGLWQSIQHGFEWIGSTVGTIFRVGPTAQEQQRAEAEQRRLEAEKKSNEELATARAQREAEEKQAKQAAAEQQRLAQEQKAAQALAERKAEEEQWRLEQERLAQEEKQAVVVRVIEEKKQREAEAQRLNVIRQERLEEAKRIEDKRRAAALLSQTTREAQGKALRASLGAQEQEGEEQEQQRTEPLLIFLDNAERSGLAGPIGIRCVMAMLQHAGPIVVSGSLLASIFQKVTLKPEVQEYYQQVKKLLAEMNQGNQASLLHQLNALHRPSSGEEKDLALQIFQDSFNPREWWISQINPQLFVFIPTWWIEQARDRIALLKVPTNLLVPPLALATGLLLGADKDQTLKTSEDIRRYVAKFRDVYTKHDKYSGSEYFLDIFKFFVPREVYTTLNKLRTQEGLPLIQSPSWALYLAGHGRSGSVIAGLALQQIKTFLDFMATTLSTRIFIYYSCFATGTAAYQLYKEPSGKKRVFNFPIIAESMPDAMALTSPPTIPYYFSPEYIDNKHHTLKLISNLNYRAFVDEIQQATDFNGYLRTLPSICIALQDFKGNVGTAPQIKLPGLEWFSFFDVQKKTFAIGRVLAATRKKPLNVARYLGKQYTPIEAILFYVDYVPFDLVIDTPYFPMFLSMKGWRVKHVINKVITRSSLAMVIQSFYTATRADAPRAYFLIKTLVCSDGVFRDVLIEPNLISDEATMEAYITTEQGNYRKFSNGVWNNITQNYMQGRYYETREGSTIGQRASAIATFFEFKPLYNAIDKGNVVLVRRIVDTYPAIDDTILERVEKAREKAGSDSARIKNIDEIQQVLNDYLERAFRKPQELLNQLFYEAKDDARIRLIRVVQEAEHNAEALVVRDNLIKAQRNNPERALQLLESMIENKDRAVSDSPMLRRERWATLKITKPFKESVARSRL